MYSKARKLRLRDFPAMVFQPVYHGQDRLSQFTAVNLRSVPIFLPLIYANVFIRCRNILVLFLMLLANTNEMR
ncbi:hypothetical protein SAMN04489760_11356 [Syntrophus gentianae]|uniref:Uncharacterized protein n=1 Tax=Syntrophus gentianae TaxID=43775 RepID=A0A1H7Y1J9_9BACT|nr:hypothetical protein SAMN04489760_11356 [Syntrophus gentianae]